MKVLKLKDVLIKTSLSKNTLLRLEREGVFPRRIKITPEGTRQGWIEEDVDNWIKARRGDSEQKCRGNKKTA